MAEAFIGEIRMFAGNFAPRSWALCNGQLLNIADNQALFSILGTTYGGDGRQTFGLPDLRERTPGHAGGGPGLTPRRLGERYGAATVTLDVTQLPAHNHPLQGTDATASTADPNAGVPAATLDPGYTAAADGAMAAGLQGTGGGQPHENRPPYLVVNYIIATAGVFPARN